MSVGPQLVLIEIIRLQMKMGEALAIANGRIARLETGIEDMIPPELKPHYEKLTQEGIADFRANSQELTAQVERVMASLERYTNG